MDWHACIREHSSNYQPADTIGHASTVALLGSTLNDGQAEMLLSLNRPIVLLFDGDESGLIGGRKAAGKLITNTFVRVLRLPDGIDPSDMEADQLRELLNTATWRDRIANSGA